MPEASSLCAAITAAAQDLRCLPSSDGGMCGGWQCDYSFAPQSAVFDGHFPHKPILPAVVQCLMAQCLVEKGQERPLRLAAIVQAKFTRVVGPEVLTLSVSPASKPNHWDAILSVGGEPAAKLRLHLEEMH